MYVIMHNAWPVAYVKFWDRLQARAFIIEQIAPIREPIHWTDTNKCMLVMHEWVRPRGPGKPRAVERTWLRWTGWEYIETPSVPDYRLIRRDI